MRRGSRAAALAALVLAMGAGGCAEGGRDAGTGGAGEPATTASPRDTASLRVTYRSGDGSMRRERLHCGGSDADTCARLAELIPALRPEPDAVCTEIYGGPERITVVGQLGSGMRVNLRVTRTDGCEIHRYDLLKATLAP